MQARAQIATFLYHDAADDPTESGFQRRAALPYKHTRQAFVENLDRIAAAGHQIGLATELDFSQPGRHILLTFDDGGRSACFEADELERRGWRGHFFVTTNRIGTPTFLTTSQMLDLHQRGHLVGSHSHTHPDIFRAQRPAEMIQEWQQSCRIIEDAIGAPCVVASVPGGDISAEVLKTAGTAGLQMLFTSEPWLVPRRVGDCWVLGRACPKNSTPLRTIEHLARFRGWQQLWLERRMKVAARRCVSPLYKQYVKLTTRETRSA